MDSCPSQKTTCQYCGDLLPNSQIPSHQETTCPSSPIPCPHINLGCQTPSLPRSTLQQHLTTCPFHPLSPLLSTLLTRLSRLESQPPPPPDPEIDRLRADLDILNQALSDLEIRFSNAVVAERIRMGEEVERLRAQVGALRREVWFSRRREGGAGIEIPTAAAAAAPGRGTAGGGDAGKAEMVPPRRLSGMCFCLWCG